MRKVSFHHVIFNVGILLMAIYSKLDYHLLFPEINEPLAVRWTAGRQLGAAEQWHAPVARVAARLDHFAEALPVRLPVGECIECGQYPLQRAIRSHRQRGLAVRIVESVNVASAQIVWINNNNKQMRIYIKPKRCHNLSA